MQISTELQKKQRFIRKRANLSIKFDWNKNIKGDFVYYETKFQKLV